MFELENKWKTVDQTLAEFSLSVFWAVEQLYTCFSDDDVALYRVGFMNRWITHTTSNGVSLNISPVITCLTLKKDRLQTCTWLMKDLFFWQFPHVLIFFLPFKLNFQFMATFLLLHHWATSSCLQRNQLITINSFPFQLVPAFFLLFHFPLFNKCQPQQSHIMASTNFLVYIFSVSCWNWRMNGKPRLEDTCVHVSF